MKALRTVCGTAGAAAGAIRKVASARKRSSSPTWHDEWTSQSGTWTIMANTLEVGEMGSYTLEVDR